MFFDLHSFSLNSDNLNTYICLCVDHKSHNIIQEMSSLPAESKPNTFAYSTLYSGKGKSKQ